MINNNNKQSGENCFCDYCTNELGCTTYTRETSEFSLGTITPNQCNSTFDTKNLKHFRFVFYFLVLKSGSKDQHPSVEVSIPGSFNKCDSELSEYNGRRQPSRSKGGLTSFSSFRYSLHRSWNWKCKSSLRFL